MSNLTSKLQCFKIKKKSIDQVKSKYTFCEYLKLSPMNVEVYFPTIRCVLCRRKNDKSVEFKNIQQTKVHTSKKTIKDVLNHIAKCIKSETVLPDMAFVCAPCYDKLAEYDQIMLQLLVHQRELSRLLETSMNTLEYSDEDDDFSSKEEVLSDNSIEALSDPDNDADEESFQEVKERVTYTIPPVASYECSICHNKLSSKSSLRTHLEAHAKAKRCQICGVIRRDEEYLELHMNVHEGKSENECRYCPKRYSRRSNVIRHMHLHWDKKKFQCEKCGLRFSQGYLLYNHKMHHEAEEKPLVCTKCDQTFKSKKTFSHHMVTHREDRPMYPCEVCGKKFTEKYTLKVHSKVHKEPSEEDSDALKKRDVTIKKKATQEFVCVICDRIFNTKDVLDGHMAEEHDVIGPIKVFM